MAKRWAAAFLAVSGLIVLVFGLEKESRFPVRQLSSVEQIRLIPQDLNEGVQYLRGFIQGDRFNAESCAESLSVVYDELLDITAEHFDLASAERHAVTLMQDLFLARLELRNKLGQMIAVGDTGGTKVSEECVDAIRNIFRAGRFIEEYLAEWKAEPPQERALAGGAPAMMFNPRFTEPFELRSGDVILSRGNAVVSAAIARIGDKDGQFSHLALVYKDEKTQKVYVIEAHIEVGTVVSPIETYVSDGKLRAVVFRQKDGELGRRAAKAMYDRALAATARGENIPYDFGMVLNETSELFCSEVPYEGYRVASDGQFIFPLFQTRMEMKNRAFLGGIGIKVRRTFAPSDIEVDPRFELVAEWRNFGKTQRARMLDAVLTQMYDWMEQYNYRLRNTLGQKIAKNVAWTLRRVPLFERLVDDKFPKNMKRAALGTMVALDAVALPLLGELERVAALRIKNGQLAMTVRDMREVLNKLRQDDFARYQAWRAYDPDSSDPIPPKLMFHRQFRP